MRSVLAAVVSLALAVAACSTASRPPARAASTTAAAQPAAVAPAPAAETAGDARAARRDEPRGLDRFQQQILLKQLADLSFFTQLGDEMIVRKVDYAGADGMIIPAYFFAPRDTTVRRPAIIMVHGGVHGDFDDMYVPEVRALVAQGYVIVAPEYRGSTGYGRAHYDAIDYGGKEVEDCIAARDYLAAFVPYADTSRVGIMGWSHGGFITLHALIRRPELFRVGVAHVPVADLPARIRTHSEAYHRIFAAQPGFGGRLEERPENYVARSPIAHARKLTRPVLVHAADNDDDVFIIENRNLRDSMVAAGKDKEGLYVYREWHNPPGGHSFSRVDTPQARESWRETVAFLNKYLQPGKR